MSFNSNETGIRTLIENWAKAVREGALDGVGHFLHLEQPEVFNTHLLEVPAELTRQK